MPLAADAKSLASIDLLAFKDTILKLLSSKAVYAGVWTCLASCTYTAPGTEAPVRITKSTFQPEEARQDFLPAAWEVLTLNVTPFFGSLASLFSAPGEAKK
jgi:hypothetical protein